MKKNSQRVLAEQDVQHRILIKEFLPIGFARLLDLQEERRCTLSDGLLELKGKVVATFQGILTFNSSQVSARPIRSSGRIAATTHPPRI